MPEQPSDWTLPQIYEWKSLWPCFHDGLVTNLAYDPLARTLTLEIKLGFPRPPEKTIERAVLLFQGVTHLVVFSTVAWAGPPPVYRKGMTHEGRRAELDEYQAKAHVEGVSLHEAERLFKESSFEILDPYYCNHDGVIALQLDGIQESGDGWYRILVAGSSVLVEADGKPSSFAELIAVGESAWETWRAKPDE